jgi:mRNA interferase RelE/StbE
MDYEVKPSHELWRLRLDNWRIVYLIDREWDGIYVLAVRKRPPYQYQDLPDLLADAE